MLVAFHAEIGSMKHQVMVFGTDEESREEFWRETKSETYLLLNENRRIFDIDVKFSKIPFSKNPLEPPSKKSRITKDSKGRKVRIESIKGLLESVSSKSITEVFLICFKIFF